MKILVFAHELEIGGTQTNAIDLAVALRDLHGYDMVLFATPGPMVEVAKQKGLRFIPAPTVQSHPSAVRMQALRDAVRSEKPDLIHVWDWWQCLDAYYAVYLPMRIPMIVSDMMMNLTRILPKHLPTTFGTPEVVDRAKCEGRRPVELLLPPVDVDLNAPDSVGTEQFRMQYSVKKGEIMLVTVSRLATSMKAESLFETINAVRTLGRDLPVRLLIVGDGEARARLKLLADQVNCELGRCAVIVAGALLDPRPAYASADIVIGMGGSVLRGMAFAKPVVIVGERGFSGLFAPETAESFYYKGMYGVGDRGRQNSLLADIQWLLNNSCQWSALGEFSRQFVVQHFSIETVSSRLAHFCQSAMNESPKRSAILADGIRTAAICLRERRFLAERHPLKRGMRALKAKVLGHIRPRPPRLGKQLTSDS